MKYPVVLSLINMRPRKRGTVEEYCLFLSQALTQKGWKSVLGFIESPPPWLNKEFETAGADVEVVNLNRPLKERLGSLRKVIKEYEVNILHSTFLNMFSFDTPLMKLCGVEKTIFSDQVSRTPIRHFRLRDIVARSKKKAIARWIDMIIADAEFIKKDIIDNVATDPRKVSVIYNGVNLERFCIRQKCFSLKIELGVPMDYRVVTTVAKCIPEKGIDIFLHAASAVSEQIDKVFFLIVGDGPLLEDLKTLSASLGISGHTMFLGLRSDVEEIMAISDVFVLCSMWQEAFAFTLLEAMASGLPVVASRIGAIPESIEDGVTGFLFSPGDAGEAARSITDLLMNDTLRRNMGLAGRKRVETSFSMERWVNETINVYERILQSPG